MPVKLEKLFQNQTEQDNPETAVVQGTIPNWLNGLYARVGPGKFDIGEVSMTQFIDGYAMLSKFEIEGGKVTFDKKFLQSEAFKKACDQKKPFFPEFGTKGTVASTKSLFSRVTSTFSSGDITDNDAMNLYAIEGDLYAATETCHIHNVNPANLATGEKTDFYKLCGVHMATAHPMVDSKGDLYNIGTGFTATGAKYIVYKVPKTGRSKDSIKKVSVVASFYPSYAANCSYYHSFGMTENFIIFIEQPCLLNVLKLTDAKLKGKGIRDIMNWSPNDGNRFIIVDKRNGEVYKTKYTCDEAFFFFHISNSYEEDDHIVMDIDCYSDLTLMDNLELAKLREGNLDGTKPGKLCRFVLPLVKDIKDLTKGDSLVKLSYTTATARREGDAIVVSSQVIGEPGFDGCTINPKVQCKKYTYVYGTGAMMPGRFANRLCKVNVNTGETLEWRDPENEFVFPGEPRFVPNPEAVDEDDGVVITTCSDARGKPEGQDYLVFLDATNMKELGRALVKSQIPQTLHGMFIEKSALAKK